MQDPSWHLSGLSMEQEYAQICRSCRGRGQHQLHPPSQGLLSVFQPEEVPPFLECATIQCGFRRAPKEMPISSDALCPKQGQHKTQIPGKVGDARKARGLGVSAVFGRMWEGAKGCLNQQEKTHENSYSPKERKRKNLSLS